MSPFLKGALIFEEENTFTRTNIHLAQSPLAQPVGLGDNSLLEVVDKVPAQMREPD